LPFKIRVETATLEGVVIPEDIQEQIFLADGGGIDFPMAFKRWSISFCLEKTCQRTTTLAECHRYTDAVDDNENFQNTPAVLLRDPFGSGVLLLDCPERYCKSWR